MSWLDKTPSSKVKDRSKNEIASSVPEGLWHKCPAYSATIYPTKLQQNHQVCPKCSHHNPLSAREWLNPLSDEGSDEEIGTSTKPIDLLKSKDSRKYPDQLTTTRKATGEDDILVVMKGTTNGLPVVVAVFEFRSIRGSMGFAVGERLVQGVHRMVAGGCPLICVTVSGDTRIQGGVNSLMQMTKTSTALRLLTEKGLSSISVLTDPTMDGVLASFTFLGDVVLAEPNALIGPADPRAIKRTVRETLLGGFQWAEFLPGRGVIDRTIDCRSMKRRICDLITLFYRRDKAGTAQAG